MMKTRLNRMFIVMLSLILLSSLFTHISIGTSLNEYESKFIELKAREVSDNLIGDLKDLIKEIEASDLIFAQKHKLLSEINILIDEINSKEKNPSVENIHKKLEEGIKFKFKDGNLYLDLPIIDENYKLSLSLVNRNTKEIIDTGDIKEGLIKLPNFTSKVDLEIAISIIDMKTNKEESALLVERTFEDEVKPSLNYTYIKDEKVYIDYEDNYLLGDKSAFYIKDGKEIEIKDKTFPMGDLKDTSLIIRDLFNNESRYELKLEGQNNKVIYGKPPVEILKDLLKGEFLFLEDIENLVLVKIPNKVNISQTYENLLKSYFKTDRLEDIKFNEEVEIKSKGLLVETAKKDDKDLKLYIYGLNSLEDKDSNIKMIKPKLDEGKVLVVRDEKINLRDFLNIEYTSKLEDRSSLFVREHGSKILKQIEDEINILPNSNNQIEIIDILEDKVFKMNIIHNEKAKETTSISEENTIFNKDTKVANIEFKQYYFDVDKDHWASKAITRMTDSGVLRGYEDRKFKPDANVTVKEFLVMLGRFIHLQEPAILNPSIESRAIEFEYWGEKEGNNVITRIDEDTIKNFDLDNITRKITREEVAFIIAHSIRLNRDTSLGANLSDIGESKYKTEIEHLYLNEISKGMPDGSFGPSRNIKRSEVVELLNNMLK